MAKGCTQPYLGNICGETYNVCPFVVNDGQTDGNIELFVKKQVQIGCRIY